MRKADGWSRQDFARGTTYQLCISYPNQNGEGSPNPGLERAYRALWSASCMDGPWTEPEEIGNPTRKSLPGPPPKAFNARYGILGLGNGLGCRVCLISEGPSDALVLDKPGGTLRKLFSMAPQMHSPANQVWRDPLTRLYWDIAEVIYRLSPFAVAGWGEEAGGIMATEDHLTLNDLERGGYLISSQLRSRLGPGRQGTPLTAVDPRGPGLLSGTNPYNVSLAWDGLDASNTTVSGNITWVMTARTTNYVAGSPANDGIYSSQNTLNDSIAGPIAQVKKIKASNITLLDVHNKPFVTPQYDRDENRNNPIALPIRDDFPTVDVAVSILLPPDDEPEPYLFWGETPEGQTIFGPIQRTPVAPGFEQPFPVRVDKIAKYPLIHWYFVKKSGGPFESMGTTNSPIYVTLDSPAKPQEQPRVDVVDFAVESQKLNPNSKNRVQIATYLTAKIWNRDTGYLYDGLRQHHTSYPDGPKKPEKMVLQVSNFIKFPGNVKFDPEGNCEDFSNLFQVCGAALGVQQFRVLRINGPFDLYPVEPVGIGYPIESEGQLQFHQVGWFSGDDTVYDPTYFLLHRTDPPLQAKNLPLAQYRAFLEDPETAERRGRSNTWSPAVPVKVLSVK